VVNDSRGRSQYEVDVVALASTREDVELIDLERLRWGE